MLFYKNNFGLLNDDGITLLINDKEQTINLKNLVRISYMERQKFHFNYIAFLLSIYLLFFLNINVVSYFVQIMIIAITTVLLVVSFYFKTFQYRFVLINKNYTKEIIVSKNLSKDAQNMADQINKINKG